MDPLYRKPVSEKFLLEGEIAQNASGSLTTLLSLVVL